MSLMNFFTGTLNETSLQGAGEFSEIGDEYNPFLGKGDEIIWQRKISEQHWHYIHAL